MLSQIIISFAIVMLLNIIGLIFSLFFNFLYVIAAVEPHSGHSISTNYNQF